MAKMFYTMEEAKTALGRTEDEIKALTREGKLREFRDGPRLMFKADQVDALKGSLPPKDTIDIADSGAPISLVDSKSGTGTGAPLGLAGDSRAGSPVSIKDDTSAGDLGLGGSRAGSRSGTGTGMNIFSTEDDADPSAATAITPASEGGNLESVGSGSGLLDLTRESDDTSLGAVLDEISPGKRDAGGTRAGTATGVPVATAIGGGTAAASMGRPTPMVVARPDATAPFFGGLALGGAVLSLLALFVLTAAVTGSSLSGFKQLLDNSLMIVAGVLAVIVLICGGLGFALGKVLK